MRKGKTSGKTDIKLDLMTAYRMVMNDMKNDFLPDIIDYRDFRHDLENQLEQIKVERKNGYKVGELLTIDVPKYNYLLRPGSVPTIRDRIVYQAVVNAFASKIEKKLEADTISYGYRLNTDNKGSYFFKNNVKQWLKLRKRIKSIWDQKEYLYLLNTDLTAYFEHINLGVLAKQLLSLGMSIPPNLRHFF